MTQKKSDALVFFGATGDLAYKQIFPALQALVQRDDFDLPIIGVAKAGWSLKQFHARAKASISEHGEFSAEAFAKMVKHLHYIDGDYADASTFTQLRTALHDAKHPLYYLAIPPSLFGVVVTQLGKSGGTQGARVIVEKPFGRDVRSAQTLNATLQQAFAEDAIFRIDHYLGKEPVQNLIYFRFANPPFDASWDCHHVESVQITMAEEFGIKGRGKFYEEAGAIRDVVQNHMLEVIACLAMECPVSTSCEAQRDARGTLLKAIRPLTAADVVRGQFNGYKKEPGVAADSQVETFAALRFYIDNPRWDGVPFFVRVGKCLPLTCTEVLVRFKRPHRAILADTAMPMDSYCRFRLSPEMVVALGTKVKAPGEEMAGEPVELVAHRHTYGEMRPYERLIGDALHGDGTLFAREDATEAAWRVVQPVLGNVTPVQVYEPGTWGPAEVPWEPEGGWHNPSLSDA